MAMKKKGFAKKKKPVKKMMAGGAAGMKKKGFAKMSSGGRVPETKAKRPYNGKLKPRRVVARGCGVVMANKRKQTTGAVRA